MSFCQLKQGENEEYNLRTNQKTTKKLSPMGNYKSDQNSVNLSVISMQQIFSWLINDNQLFIPSWSLSI